MPLNIPNALTWARIVMIPIFVGIFYLPDALMPIASKNLVATVIFVASIVVPVGKFLAIGYLAIAVRRGRAGGSQHQLLFEVVDFIGRWSMIDVFVVAILAALVQLGFVAAIKPGPAAASFALSVAFTMLSAQSFDPRLIWRGLPLHTRKDP